MSMFTSPKRTEASYDGSAIPSSANKTVIARGVKVEGDFTSQGDVVIEGEVHGKIAASGTLTVGIEAVIKADVMAEEAVISGSVEGNLNIKKQAILHASAKVRGDLTVERATVESGAMLDGRVQIGQPAPSSVRASTDSRQALTSVSPAIGAAHAE